MPAEVIRPGSFLAELGTAALGALLDRAHELRIGRGEALVVEGENAGGVYVITSGWCKVVTVSTEGKEVVLALSGPGDLIGELALLRRRARMASVVAITDAAVTTVDAASFHRLIAHERDIALALVTHLAAKLIGVERRRTEWATASGAARIHTVLLDLLDDAGVEVPGGHVIDIPLTQDEIAGLAGVSRETAARVLRGLRAAGAISTHRRRLVVHDRAPLRAGGAS